MTRFIRSLTSAAALLVTSWMFSAGPAHAYAFYCTTNCALITSPTKRAACQTACQANPDLWMRWWRRELTFHTAQTAPKDFDLARFPGLAETALGQWIDTTCGLVPTVTYGGSVFATQATLPLTTTAEPDNVFVFITESSQWLRLGNAATYIAITKIAHDTKSGEIVDADMEINNGGYTFSVDGEPAVGQVDFLWMLTHEAGHFFGLDHSDVAGSTMIATYAGSPAEVIAARTLDADDTAGICALYTDTPEHVDPKDKKDDGCATGPLGSLLGLSLLALRRRRHA